MTKNGFSNVKLSRTVGRQSTINKKDTHTLTRNHNKLLYYKMRNIIRHPVYYVSVSLGFCSILACQGKHGFSQCSSFSFGKVNAKKERRIDETEEKSVRTKELITRQPNAVLFFSHFSSLLLAFSMSLFDFRFVVFFPPLLYACFMHCNGTATTSASLSYAFWLYSSFHIINNSNNNQKRLKLHTCNLGEWVCACLCVLSMCWALSILRVFWFSFQYFMNFSGLVTTVLTVPCHSNGTKNNNNKNRSLYV